MRVLIVGSGGLLGGALQQAFADFEVLAWTRLECDISLPQTVEQISRAKPDLVVNAAAWTDVDKAEDPNHWPQVHAVNSKGVAHLIQGCESANAKMIHISTNEVFPGKPNKVYAETDPTFPINAYGKSKSMGENLLTPHLNRHLLIRVSWLFGPGGDHFPAKIGRAADKLPELRVVEDEIGNPTYTVDAARRIRQLTCKGVTGIFHVTNPDIMSRYEWACHVLEETGRTETTVRPIPGRAWKRAAPTPSHAVLKDNRMEPLGFSPLPPLRDALLRHVALQEAWVFPTLPKPNDISDIQRKSPNCKDKCMP